MAYGNRSPGFEAEIIHWAQHPYHIRVPALLALTYVCVGAVYALGLPLWLLFFGLPPYLLATIATNYELRRKDRSGWWTLLMIAKVNLGPTWLGILVGIAVNLTPVLLAPRSPEPQVWRRVRSRSCPSARRSHIARRARPAARRAGG